MLVYHYVFWGLEICYDITIKSGRPDVLGSCYFPLSTNQSRPLLKNQWLLFIFSLIVQSLLHYLQYNIGGCVGVVWSLAAHKPQQRQHGLQVINAEPWAPVQTYQLESAFQQDPQCNFCVHSNLRSSFLTGFSLKVTHSANNY